MASRSRNVNARASVQIESHLIPAHGTTPNTSIQNKPLQLYRAAFSPSVTASEIESHLKFIGVVQPAWRYTMYDFDHFHTTAHEVLVISNGRAKLSFGGRENENGVKTTVSKGDVIVIPAGVSHSRVEDLENGFEMVGSYEAGKNWDMCYGKSGEERKVEAIKDLAWFQRDPIFGD